MIETATFAERVRGLFTATPRGVVGLVDDILELCRVHQLRINFQDGHCYVRPLGSDADDLLDVPLPKSVFRAVLARFAVLCNENQPGSVTPYGGKGEIVVPTPELETGGFPSTYAIAFTNTPSEQRLEVRFAKSSFADGRRFTVLLRDNRTVTVFGHILKYLPSAMVYKILSRIGNKRVVVAVFPHSEVRGVFSGDIRQPSESAVVEVSTGTSE